MNTQELKKQKKQLLDAQEKMLNSASEAKTKLDAAQEAEFANMQTKIDELDKDIVRFDAIAKSKKEIGITSDVFIADEQKSTVKNSKILSAEYCTAFWSAIQSKTPSNSWGFRNAALGEGGTAADGSYLVPSVTDPTIPALAVIEASARKLSRVIPTEMDIKLPYQSAKTVAAAKAESNASGTNAFATNNPQFNTTTLTAFMAGDSVYVSWELLQDVKALSAFVTADLNRAVFNYEENKFINGSGSGEPLGYLNGATAFETATLTISNVLDLIAALPAAYYANASFLMRRSEFHRLYKAQIAASQFQTYITWTGNQPYILGYPVYFSSQMPGYVASPATNGAVLFGDFSAGFTIGDRGGSGIQAKVLDQVAALNGQTVVLGYRRTDQRCILQEAVQLLTTNG